MKPRGTPTTSRQPSAMTDVSETLDVAYHDGPPEIEYLGRHWARGIAQPMPRHDFETLKARPDASLFNFTLSGSGSDAAGSITTEE